MSVIPQNSNVYFFALRVSYLECEMLYQPGYNTVVLTADSGQRVQVPTVRLRPFIQRTGIKGRFRMVTDANNKIMSFEKIA